MGVRSLLAMSMIGGAFVCLPRFDVMAALDLIAREKITNLYLVPTLYHDIVHHERFAASDVSSVRKLGFAGASMTDGLLKQLSAAFKPDLFVNHYGSSEIYTFTIEQNAPAKPGSAGRAGIFARLRLIAPEPGAPPDALVGRGEQGQVIVAMDSPEAFAGYWQRPDADEKAIRDGWYYTGDLATADEDGDLWVAGRVDDMINSGGENIYPDEIEAALIRCPDIDDVCVVGLPDERWGQAVTAFVVAANGIDPAEAAGRTVAFAREALPSLRQPKRVVAVRSIPRSGVGKTLRRTLVAGEFEPLADVRREQAGTPGGGHG
jgi:2-furoate---CoA ligase